MRKLILIVPILLALLIVAGWISWRHHVFNEQKKSPVPVNRQEFETDATEAVIRTILGELQGDRLEVCFLGFGEHCTAPSLPFLARFRSANLKVTGFRSAVQPPNGMVLDQTSGRKGAIVQILKIAPYVVNEYDVTVIIHKSEKAPERFIYRMANLVNGWTLKSRR